MQHLEPGGRLALTLLSWMPMRRAALGLVLAVLGMTAETRLARADPDRPAGLAEHLAKGAPDGMTVVVPLMPAESAELVIANTDRLHELGLVKAGPEDRAYEKEVRAGSPRGRWPESCARAPCGRPRDAGRSCRRRARTA